ncbi:tektin-2-like [Sipha flava]|uniref:Tektin n=1 Tax=Sipha flava TaxID=143950 RepID=A0A8B8GI63_9HEMI|nr:tektin-2-like [Sipha flava]
MSEIKASCDEIRDKTLKLKNDSHCLRDETDINTYWNTRYTREAFEDRSAEITLWKNVIQLLYDDLEREVQYMQDDKSKTEDVLKFLNLNFKITNHCKSIRDERESADFCHDNASVELDVEHKNLEKLKTLLTETCQAAWEQLNKLQELKMNVAHDLENKVNAICINTKLLELTKNSEYLHLKDPSRVAKQSITYEKWLQWCKHLKRCIKDELVLSKKMRESMFLPRNKTKYDLRSQNDKINSALRKRIYETKRIQNELEWLQYNLLTDKERLLKEIKRLEDTVSVQLNSKKLAETLSDERTYIRGAELCTDITENSLKKERFQLDSNIKNLTCKLDQTRRTFNDLLEQISAITVELEHKKSYIKSRSEMSRVQKTTRQKELNSKES